MIETNGFSGMDLQIQRAAHVLAAQRKAWAAKLQQAQQPAPKPKPAPSRWTPAPARRMVSALQEVQSHPLSRSRGMCACGKPEAWILRAGSGGWQTVCAACYAPTIERLQRRRV